MSTNEYSVATDSDNNLIGILTAEGENILDASPKRYRLRVRQTNVPGIWHIVLPDGNGISVGKITFECYGSLRGWIAYLESSNKFDYHGLAEKLRSCMLPV